MDTEGLSIICAGLGSIDKDEEGNVDYIKEEFCLGKEMIYEKP